MSSKGHDPEFDLIYSSRLEGNTYSLLETQRLIAFGEAAPGKTPFETQMILNHKAAIEFLVNAVDEIGFDRQTILNLHALLSDNLLGDPSASGRLRAIPVGIGKSVYEPLAVPQLIEEIFRQILDTAAAISDPFEQAFFVTIHLPYLQPFEDVNKRGEWYSGRWGIEVYHRTLKSGCRIKDRQFGTADRIETCLGVDMVVAWRIYHLTMLGREVPESPCTVFFKDIEWKALCCYVNKTPVSPEKPPSLGEAIYMVGGIGGHLGRKSDGFPGTQTLWRGLQRLDTATEMYAIFTQHQPPHPLQSGP